MDTKLFLKETVKLLSRDELDELRRIMDSRYIEIYTGKSSDKKVATINA
jgi:hypothetical protein